MKLTAAKATKLVDAMRAQDKHLQSLLNDDADDQGAAIPSEIPQFSSEKCGCSPASHVTASGSPVPTYPPAGTTRI